MFSLLAQELTDSLSPAAPISVVSIDSNASAHPTLLARLVSYSPDPGPGLEVEVTHFSEPLLGLRSPVALQPGTEYRVQMGAGALAELCGLRVVASRRRPDGQHDIGAVCLKSRLSAAA
jgi:uncharacterized protein (DUF2345 family)